MLNVISLGAGVQSSVMALMAASGEIKPMPDCAIFADTQFEPEGVYAHLNWLKTQLPFPVHTVTKGSLRQAVINGGGQNDYMIPFHSMGGMGRRQCTKHYKIDPLVKEVRKLLGLKYRQRWFEQRYPLRPLVKSACVACPFHNNVQWRDMKLNDPRSFEEAVQFDKAVRINPTTGNEQFVHRSCKPLDEVDFRNLEDMGQLNFFNEECEGMCGV
jgi:hypothetical protein